MTERTIIDEGCAEYLYVFTNALSYQLTYNKTIDTYN